MIRNLNKSGCLYIFRGFADGLQSNISEIWRKPIGYDTGICIYNSLTRCKTPLILSRGKQVYWYMCGPTVYDDAHIGHASCYMKFDIIRRVLENFFDLNVVQLMGITDIDDKIITKSNEQMVEYWQIAKKYEKDFLKDLRDLGIIPPTTFMRVSEFVPSIIKFIEKLVRDDFGYLADDGSIYFNVSKYGQKYGKLMPSINRTLAEEPSNQIKKNVADFALWKATKPGEPWWDSPWGKGRPGWHIECSTMASHIFGNELDIHTGGKDLLFPHHENELAQSTAYHNVEQWVNYWMHSGHVNIRSEKMSKSLKNVITIQEFLHTHSSNEFRIFCLRSHYRYDVDYSDTVLNEAKAIFQKLTTFLSQVRAYLNGNLQCSSVDEVEMVKKLEDCNTQIRQALADDFDTNRALESILMLVNHTNKMFQIKETITDVRSPAVIASVGNFVEKFFIKLGVTLQTSQVGQTDVDVESIIENTVKFRNEIRTWALHHNKDGTSFEDLDKKMLKLCDKLRTQMGIAGVKITDHGKNSSWKLESSFKN